MIQRNKYNVTSNQMLSKAVLLVTLAFSGTGNACAAINQNSATLRADSYYFELGQKVHKLYEKGSILRSPEYRDLSEPFEELRCALQKDVTDAKTHFNAARWLQGTTYDDDWVIDEYTKCLALNPKDVSALNNRAVCKYKIGNKIGAVQDLTTAINIAPSNATFYRNRSLIYSALSKERRSKKDQKEAQRIDRSIHSANAPNADSLKLGDLDFQLLPYCELSENANPQKRDRIAQQLSLLTVANKFADGVSGLSVPANAKDYSFLAFKGIATSGKKVSSNVLLTNFRRSTPAGKLYIAALMKLFDPDSGNRVLQKLTTDQTSVDFKDGCCSDVLTVSIISQFLLSPKGLRLLMDCENLITITDLYEVSPRLRARGIENFSQANEFKELKRYVGCKSPNPFPFSGDVSLAELQKHYSTASFAGKLYIAAIMQKYFTPYGELALTKLSSENRKVVCATGSTPREIPVSEIAKALLANGSFEGFTLKN